MAESWYSRFEERSKKSLKGISPEDFFSLLRPKCKEIITEDELRTLLVGGKKLRIKFGADPTGALHVGHALPIMLLRLFQRMGHEIHFIIGDFTAQIGDPAGRSDKRKELSVAEVKKHMKTFVKDISPLIDIKKAKIHYNSKWLGKVKLVDFFKILTAINLGEVVQREDFRERIRSGAGVSMREANYSTLMAIDSLELKADIEVGAIDQLLNFMHTRKIMNAFGMRPEALLMTPLLEGTAGDGRKMSKSFGNAIALAASPEDQFGLVMRIPDQLMMSYYQSFADIYEYELDSLADFIKQEPHEAKKQLGMLIVSLIHGGKAAHKAREDFERRFSRKEYETSDEVSVRCEVPMPAISALAEAFGGQMSRTRIRALIEQGGVRAITPGRERAISSPDQDIEDGDLIKVGKQHLFRFSAK